MPKPKRKPSAKSKPKSKRALEEPSAINRLLISDVTESWPRTFRSLAILVGLALLLVCGSIATLIVSSSAGEPLFELLGLAPGE